MSSLSFTVSDGVATLSIQRPAVSNAIDITIIRAMHLALDQIQKGDSGARAVVITGSDDVFCSGLDLHSIDLKTAAGAAACAFRDAPLHGSADPAAQRLSLSDRRGGQRRRGRRRHEPGARERHHHGRRKRLFLPVLRAPRPGARCRHHLPSGAPHRRRTFAGLADAGGKNPAPKPRSSGVSPMRWCRMPRCCRARRRWRTGSRPDRARCSARYAPCTHRPSINSLQEQLRAERSAQEMTLENS